MSEFYSDSINKKPTHLVEQQFITGGRQYGKTLYQEEFRNCELVKENERLKKQLECIKNGEYFKQLRFERDMLESIVNENELSVMEIDYIKMARKNTELEEKIQKAIDYIKKYQEFYDYDDMTLYSIMGAGHTRTPYIKSNELLEILESSDK